MPEPTNCLAPPGVPMAGAEAGEKISARSSEQGWSAIEPLLQQIRQQHGADLKAILVYGSWLRGKTDTMLDFYVLTGSHKSLPSVWQRLLCKVLPPNVYQIRSAADLTDPAVPELRAKYALLSLTQFCNAMQHDFHSYFWARFAQPCEIIYTQDTATQQELETAFRQAAAMFIRRTLPMLPVQYSSRELWVQGLQLTYRCELRTESGRRADTLYDFNPDYYAGLTRELAPALSPSASARKWAPLSWWLRRVQGKLLSMLRLLKAAFTFNEPLQYLLWKVERHTGQHYAASARQLKHPLIFGWPLLWNMYRQGAFR